MDEELPDSERQKITDIAMAQEGVWGVHDLRTRTSGQQLFIQMHLDLDPAMKLITAHAISESVEKAILVAFPNAEALIHQDPAPESLPRGTYDT
jgi:ferrous-iron efflux pump FieF